MPKLLLDLLSLMASTGAELDQMEVVHRRLQENSATDSTLPSISLTQLALTAATRGDAKRARHYSNAIRETYGETATWKTIEHSVRRCEARPAADSASP